MSKPRVIVVAKRTPYGVHVEEQHDPHVLRLLRRRDPSVARWRRAHRSHEKTLAAVQEQLERLGAQPWILHGPRVLFDASDAALIVTVGGDGTLLAASHNVSGVPVLGVNSDPESSVGFFCAAKLDTLERLLPRALDGSLRRTELTRLQVTVNGRIASRRVLNEVLFCHAIPAATSRYILSFGRRREAHSSSGFWVGTAAGSTGATRSAGGEILPFTSPELQLVVREPFAGTGPRLRMTRLIVPAGKSVAAISKMQDALLFLDGPFKRVGVRLGDVVAFQGSDEPLTVLGLDARRRARR